MDLKDLSQEFNCIFAKKLDVEFLYKYKNCQQIKLLLEIIYENLKKNNPSFVILKILKRDSFRMIFVVTDCFGETIYNVDWSKGIREIKWEDI